jgi:hypothetical protein
MKTKDTTINFTSKSGKEVIVTVHRKYGAYVEHHHDSENGIDYDTNEFANDHDITVEVPGVCKFDTKYLPEMKHPKINMYYLSNGRYCVAVPDEIANQIFEAEREQLTDELSPATMASIKEAKAAISEGRVMAKAELSKKRKEYNNMYNEGADGYNPFDYYLTTEYVEHLKAEYPAQFASNKSETKKYNDYQISKTSQTASSGVYSAFKKEAATVNGITFSHHFYFQYCKESHDDDYVNGKACIPFKPSYDDNYYMAVVNGGVILSTDLKTFSFQDSSLGYVNYAHIDIEDLKKYHNVEVED